VQSILKNIRDLPSALSVSAVLSGLLVITIGYPSSLVIVFDAASKASLSTEQLSSWIIAITIGSGVCSIVMSLWFRQPVIAAWSTPGVALLVTSLPQYAYSEAIGAYILAALAITLLGVSGLFGRVMAMVPQPVVMGMLAGVLIRFGIGLFNDLPQSPVMIVVMLITFFVLRRTGFRAPAIGAVIAGLIVAALNGDLQLDGFAPALATPLWTAPTFTLEAILGLSLPLFVLAITSQNAPGQAVLRAAGYDTPINGALVVTGIGSLLGAPFGGHGITLAAITAALVTGPDAHTDADKRYSAGVTTGVWYVVTGIFGATIVSLFQAIPATLIHAIAGLGLLGAITSSLAASMAEPIRREGALIAFICTAANFQLLGIGAPFWGLVFGVLTNLIMTCGKPNIPNAG
jgi:benzoate membrane transport protein